MGSRLVLKAIYSRMVFDCFRLMAVRTVEAEQFGAATRGAGSCGRASL